MKPGRDYLRAHNPQNLYGEHIEYLHGEICRCVNRGKIAKTHPIGYTTKANVQGCINLPHTKLRCDVCGFEHSAPTVRTNMVTWGMFPGKEYPESCAMQNKRDFKEKRTRYVDVG